MPRIANVTYEQVAAVANALYAQGIHDPGGKAIRSELAKRAGPGEPVGSPNTIQRHLAVWRVKDRPLEAAEVPQLPAQLASDLLRALTAAASLAREKAEERSVQLQAELDDLAAVGETAEVRIDELQQVLASRTSERDSMAGQLADRTAEVEQLRGALAASQDRCRGLESEVHSASAEAQAATGRVDEIRQATERQLSQLQSELDKARVGHTTAQQAAVDADRRAVAFEAHLEGERAAKKLLEEQVVRQQEEKRRMQGDAERMSAAEATAEGLRDQVTLLRSLLDAGKPTGSGSLSGSVVGGGEPRGG